MGDDVQQLGRVRRWAFTAFGALPRPVRVRVIRTVAPSHTVGALALLEHDGHLLMLQQRHRHGWTLPGGLLDRGETAEDAVRREVREETGLEVEVGLPLTATIDPVTRRVDVIFHVPVSEQIEVVPRSEAFRAAWLRPDDAGQVDDPTRQAFEALTRSRVAGAYTGQLAGDGP